MYSDSSRTIQNHGWKCVWASPKTFFILGFVLFQKLAFLSTHWDKWKSHVISFSKTFWHINLSVFSIRIMVWYSVACSFRACRSTVACSFRACRSTVASMTCLDLFFLSKFCQFLLVFLNQRIPSLKVFVFFF